MKRKKKKDEEGASFKGVSVNSTSLKGFLGGGRLLLPYRRKKTTLGETEKQHGWDGGKKVSPGMLGPNDLENQSQDPMTSLEEDFKCYRNLKYYREVFLSSLIQTTKFLSLVLRFFFFLSLRLKSPSAYVDIYSKYPTGPLNTINHKLNSRLLFLKSPLLSFLFVN